MTKLQLLKLLENASDDAVILRPGEDHSYRNVSAYVTTAIYSPDSRSYNEDHGDECMEEGDKRIVVVVVS